MGAILKTLIFHQVGGIGGATVTLSNVVSALAGSGIEPTVICPAGPGQVYLRAAGAKVLTAQRAIRQFSHLSGFEKSALHPVFGWTRFGNPRTSATGTLLFASSGLISST
jgi:hypothetical protein